MMPMHLWGAARSSDRERLLVVAVVWSIAAAAWLPMWRAAASASSSSHAHHHHAAAAGGPGVTLFVLTWTVMCVAMMLPTSLPILTTFHALVRERRERALLLTLVAVGYLTIWAAVGVAIALAVALGRTFDAAAWIGGDPGRASAAMLTVAGAFQLTPLKYRCLDKCRSDRKSTRLNSSHSRASRMPSSA